MTPEIADRILQEAEEEGWPIDEKKRQQIAKQLGAPPKVELRERELKRLWRAVGGRQLRLHGVVVFPRVAIEVGGKPMVFWVAVQGINWQPQQMAYALADTMRDIDLSIEGNWDLPWVTLTFVPEE